MKHQRSSVAAAAVLVALLLGVAACSSSSDSAGSDQTTTTAASGGSTTTKPTSGAGPLVGTFKVTAGACTSGADVKGTYFRMVNAGGTPAKGPYVANADSTCTDKTYSALQPGTDGGLTTGAYQPQPSDPFDATKNGVADKIIEPVKFFAVGFAASTNAKDPETGKAVPEPTISVDENGKLTGKVAAVSVAWNGQQFNQGAPKPDGSSPGATAALTGTYDAKTGAYELEWASQIVGGPFDGFTGVWHFEGTFAKS